MFKALKQFGAAKTADYIFSRVQMVHLTPGRIRVVCEELKTDPKLRGFINKRLKEVAAIKTYQINRLTGSVTVEFDEAAARQDTLFAQVLSRAEKFKAHQGGTRD